jgi:NADPH-dependent F420 reductase
MVQRQTIAVLGGSGNEGSGLALRWAKAGYPVIVGSRSADKAQAAAAELNQLLGTASLQGADNRTAAQRADVAVLTVPYGAQRATALEVRELLVGKILIDVTVPLKPPKVGVVNLPPEGSAVLALQRALGPEVRVVSAFQNVSAAHLRDLQHVVDCDVLVCADDDAAGDVAVALADAAGMRGWRCGPLANSVVSEGLTSVLISINQRYKIPGSGIRITGTPKAVSKAQ